MPSSLVRVVGAVALLVFVRGPAQSGNQVPLPPHATVYNGFSTGYSFVAQSQLHITAFELPPDARLSADTAGVAVWRNGVELWRSVGNPGPVMVPSAPIVATPGDLIQLLGNWSPMSTSNFTSHSSLHWGQQVSATIEGMHTTLDALRYGWDIGDPAYQSGAFTTGTQFFGRVWIYTLPGDGLFPSFTYDVERGASPLQVQFRDTSWSSDPGGVATYAWDLDGDGVVDSTDANPSFTYPSCGAYDVTLTVTDAVHAQQAVTVVGAVVVDPVEASFTVSNVAPGQWRFVDTSQPTPIAWQWDFDGDGIVDDTAQNPVHVDPTAHPLLDLPNCTLTVTGNGGCYSDTEVRHVVERFGRSEGPLVGGNGTSSQSAVGVYFDVEVLAADGVDVDALGVAVYGSAVTFDVLVYLTDGSHVGKEGVPDAWTLVASGSVTSTGSGVFSAPELVHVAFAEPWFVPSGSYGLAVFHGARQASVATVAYTNGPAAAPYGNEHVVIHPNGVGCSATALLDPCAYQPRLWNGYVDYGLCVFEGTAAAGTYGVGCATSAGEVPHLSVASRPVFGSDYELALDAGMPVAAASLVLLGGSRTASGAVPLPLELGFVGAPGCRLYTNAVESSLLLAQPGGGNAWRFAIPNAPALQCFTFYQQAAVLDLGANALGFAFSNPTVAVIGS